VGALFFNHSCNPNAAFVGLSKGRLVFRTIRHVQPEEEIAVSYIDLYASRDERRQVRKNMRSFKNEHAPPDSRP
jgi:SET and MYND domain-containing protein